MELEGEIIYPNVPKKTPLQMLNQYQLNKNWPFMRVKNTVKYIWKYYYADTSFISKPSLRSHYEGLVFLAKRKNMTVEALVATKPENYLSKYDFKVTIDKRAYFGDSHFLC